MLQTRLGHLLVRLGQTAEAYELMLPAIESYRQQHSTANLRESLRKFGLACLQLERFSEAMRALAEARDLSNQPDIADDERSETQFAYALACLMSSPSEAEDSSTITLDEALASFVTHPTLASAPAVDDLQLLANCLQRKGKFNQAEQLLLKAMNVLNRHSFHGTRRSSVLSDLADISNHRGDHQTTIKFLLQAVECLADTEKYPSKYNQLPELDAMNRKLLSNLADRLVRVHRELSDDQGAKVWQEK
jgi:tetratricopeptide (TPR) repeat protein